MRTKSPHRTSLAVSGHQENTGGSQDQILRCSGFSLDLDFGFIPPLSVVLCSDIQLQNSICLIIIKYECVYLLVVGEIFTNNCISVHKPVSRFVVEDKSTDEGVTCLPAIKDAVWGEFFGTVFTLWSTRGAQHIKYELMGKRKRGCM